MIGITKVLVSLAPVLIFLALLVFFDSYKLVSLRSIITTIVIGGLSGVICFFITTWILRQFEIELTVYSRSISPVLEEVIKGSYLIFLMKKNKIGFMVDAAICGFAIGAGFAVVENIDYLIHLQTSNLFLWIIRGFGTAVMHGGTVCIMGIAAKSISERSPSIKLYHFLPGLLIAIAIHSFFNHILLDPRLITVIQLILLPALIALIFARSEKLLRDWLELGLDSDVIMLEFITKGQISKTNIGKYLQSIKEKFPGLILADMLCYLRINLELAIRAKGILLMKGVGFDIPLDSEVENKLAELSYLEKSIGKMGKLALTPIIHTSTRDLWQIYLVKNK